MTLDGYQAYLDVLARKQVATADRVRIDPSGVVQQTLLDAHRAAEFEGLESGQRLAWLRTALARNLADEFRRHRADKRDVLREIEASAAGLESWLAAEQSSPSLQAGRNEQVLRLTAALAELPETQREAVEQHYFHARPVAEVALAMDKTPAAVAGLLKRGLQALRAVLTEPAG